MKIYGLTGGMGSGKSSVSKLISSLGIPVICMDQISREVSEREDIKQKVLARFGTLDRAELRKKVFSKPFEKLSMDAIYQSAFIEHFQNKISDLKAAGHKTVFYDSAILLEMGLRSMMDEVIHVYCPRETRIKRVMKRDSCSREVVENVMQYQADDDTVTMLSDYVIKNTGSEEELRRQTMLVLEFIGVIPKNS